MKKDVWISIKGTQHVNGETDTVELMTDGTLAQRNGRYYISYEESSETGMEGTRTLLKIEGEERVTLSRYGARRGQLIIEKGRRHLCNYDTGYGSMMIGIFSNEITSSLTDEGGEVYFQYSLDINSSLASENEVLINIRECKRDNELH